MAEYRLTPAAEHDLEIIWTYTSQQWSVKQADRYTDMLMAAFAELAQSSLLTYSRQSRRLSKMPKTEKELIARDATRDIGAELLQAVKQMKAGKVARTTKVERRNEQ